MVGFGTVGFALSVVVVLEFDSACWAVCDAHGLCSCEYLFSELSVFFCACSAHCVSSFFLCCCVRWWRVAASARRAPPPSNTTLCFFFLSFFSFFFFLWNGGCRVVRAQLCEHARDTTLAFCVLGLSIVCTVCCFYRNVVFVVPTTHRSLLTIVMLVIEH